MRYDPALLVSLKKIKIKMPSDVEILWCFSVKDILAAEPDRGCDCLGAEMLDRQYFLMCASLLHRLQE